MWLLSQGLSNTATSSTNLLWSDWLLMEQGIGVDPLTHPESKLCLYASYAFRISVTGNNKYQNILLRYFAVVKTFFYYHLSSWWEAGIRLCLRQWRHCRPIASLAETVPGLKVEKVVYHSPNTPGLTGLSTGHCLSRFWGAMAPFECPEIGILLVGLKRILQPLVGLFRVKGVLTRRR